MRKSTRRYQVARRRYLRDTYDGLTPEAVDEAIALQHGLCSDLECDSGTELVIDLDRVTNQFRMTCRSCIARRLRMHEGERMLRVPRVRARAPWEHDEH